MVVLVLFAGASVGASIEEFAAPSYEEEDPYRGAIDDTTDEKDWRALESNDKGIEKGAKNFFGKLMSDRMNDRLEDRVSHLEERIEIGQNIVIAYQFCIDSQDCEVDATVLKEMISNLDTEKSIMIRNILFKYVKEEGSSLIMVTHDPKLADKAKRKIKIKDGKIK